MKCITKYDPTFSTIVVACIVLHGNKTHINNEYSKLHKNIVEWSALIKRSELFLCRNGEHCFPFSMALQAMFIITAHGN